MDVMNIKIDSKLSKAKDTLVDLQKEITTTLTFLEKLKQASSDIVQKLCDISSPTVCLKEYAKVNAFLLKYISFLTEINCKFEMLQILDLKNFSLTNSNLVKIKDFEDEAIVQDETTFNSMQILHNETATAKNRFEKSKQINSNSLLTNVAQPLNLKKTDNGSGNSSAENQSFLNSETVNLQASNAMIDGNNWAHASMESVKSSTNSSDTVSSHNSPNNELHKKTFSLPFSETNTGLTDNVKSDHLSVTHSLLPQSELTLENVRNSSSMEEENKDEYLKTEENGSPFKHEKETGIENTDIPTLHFLKKIGEEYSVVVEHIKSPSEFYVHFPDSEIHTLRELEKILSSIPGGKLKPKIKKGENKKSFLQKKLGSYVLYYSKTDEIWCRGKVTDWGMDHNHDLVHIFLLDYGESKCVHLNSLRPMPEHLRKYPAFAVRCHLFGICAAEEEEANKMFSWSKESIEKMKSIIEKSKDIKIQIAPHEENEVSESLPVMLWLADQDNQCVNKLLVERQFAVSIGKSSSECLSDLKSEKWALENEILEKWNPMKEDFMSNQNCYDMNINDPAAVIYGYVGKDYERICSEFSKTGKCFKGKACRKEHKFLDPLGYTKDQEDVFNEAFNILPTPESGSMISVQVTCIMQLNEFYCITNQLSIKDDEENLGTLIEFMNKKENLLEMRKSSIPPSIGQIVIAQYSKDFTWYRARILDSDVEKDEFTVIFVDFGNKETMPLSRIRTMEARYLHLPFQAIYCIIHDIELNPEVSESEALNYLNESLNDGNVNIQVISDISNNQLQLLVKMFDEYGKDIGNDLVQKGYAIRKSKTLVFDNSEILPG